MQLVLTRVRVSNQLVSIGIVSCNTLSSVDTGVNVVNVFLMHIWSVASVFIGFSVCDSFPWNGLILERFTALLQSSAEGKNWDLKVIDPNKCV